MNIINVKNCIAQFGNTGYGNCYGQMGIPRGLIFGPVADELDATSIASLKADLEAGILVDNGSLRYYPIGDIGEITANDTAPTEFTFAATGETVTTTAGFGKKTFRWNSGGYCLLISQMLSQNSTRGFMIYDHLGQLWCKKSATPDKVKFFVGKQYTNPAVWQLQGSEYPTYATTITYNPDQMGVTMAFIDFNRDNGGGLDYLSGLMGLQDIVLTQTLPRALGVFHIGATTSCGSVNLFDEGIFFGNALLWAPVNADTLKPIAVISAVSDNANRGTTVTLDTTDANYSATAGKVLLKLVGPTELDAQNITGYESIGIKQ